MQATDLPQPVKIWNYRNASARRSNHGGTYLFYSVDKEFHRLPENPGKLIRTRCAVIGELNFSTYESQPVYEVIPLIAKKRQFSQLCQAQSLRILVDLAVVPQFRGLNLTGIPKGWRSYCTRGNTARFEELGEEYEIACVHSEHSKPLFVVYGGGRKIREWCYEKAQVNPRVIHVPEMMDRRKLKKVTKTLETAFGIRTYNVWVYKDEHSHLSE